MNTKNAIPYNRQSTKRPNVRKKTFSPFVGVVISWIVIAVVFTFIGATFNETTHAKNTELEAVQVFGQYDNNIITDEIPLDWEAGNLQFTPLTDKLDSELQEFIYFLCIGYEVDYSLVIALIEQESNFDSDVISKTNDYGLMQINIRNFTWLSETLGLDDFLDPYQNVRAGIYTLRKLFEKYQDTSMVLMAYNMGDTGASRLWKQNIYSTKYSTSILMKQAQLLGDRK